MKAVALAASIAFSLIQLTGCAAGPDPLPTGSVSELRQEYPEPIDLARARASCLRKKGWPVSVDADGAISINLGDDETADYDAADIACLKRIGVDPYAATPEWALEQAYGFHTAGADCLRHLGYEIAPGPTYETFKDTYETQAWWPWDEIPAQDQPRAEKKCPTPPPIY